MICTADVYTSRTRAAKRGARPAGPARRRAALVRTVALGLALAGAAGARGEELIRVRVSESPERIEELRLEDYVAGVVSGEMPASFPAEALKAQAVAARSYALTRKIEAQAANRRWDIATGVLAQVYRQGASGPARAATAATAGEVMVAGVEPLEAYFHASCGGTTEAGLAALGRGHPYLPSVECGRCARAPGARWSVRIDARALASAARLRGAATDARVTSRTPSGRAERIEISAGPRRATVAATDLRQRLGYGRLPSLAFAVRAERGAFVFEGRGHGHGAGLCQWGAAGLAREGRGYREILGHYYPGADVVRMY
ncbi:SpoIID/LytB domain-containing protein [Anaeromyxobacter sp. Fw109-5]|uniref:SpoIID/LytB domain-containing protein n=1 Tax=Anaeromyxobacter sp. (strain Fw109-5) TaxID=404589 RepID=UPI0009FDC5F8|nr:SpoIID/LytB domain-containing protein [Anaeromyxobacter sp. Fw109-5]